jgi:hypothetical protein
MWRQSIEQENTQMYKLNPIMAAIATQMPALVAAIQAAEQKQPMTARAELDVSSAVEAFIDTLMDDASFYQSCENDDDASEQAESDARDNYSKAMTAWRLEKFGMTWREKKAFKAKADKVMAALNGGKS